MSLLYTSGKPFQTFISDRTQRHVPDKKSIPGGVFERSEGLIACYESPRPYCVSGKPSIWWGVYTYYCERSALSLRGVKMK